MTGKLNLQSMNETQIMRKVENGLPLSHDEAVWLLTEADLLSVGKLADGIRKRLHPENRVTFVVDRNVNYTNICESKCRFCAFYRDHGAPDAYLLAEEEIYAKIRELVDQGGTQLLMQGGLHPSLGIEVFPKSSSWRSSAGSRRCRTTLSRPRRLPTSPGSPAWASGKPWSG